MSLEKKIITVQSIKHNYDFSLHSESKIQNQNSNAFIMFRNNHYFNNMLNKLEKYRDCMNRATQNYSKLRLDGFCNTCQ